MTTTTIDMPKVTQMLDAGWLVCLAKNDLGTYFAEATHEKEIVWTRAKDKWSKLLTDAGWEYEQCELLLSADWGHPGVVETDDRTPEQALTRLAYKVHGEMPPDSEATP
ncbi:MAG: hypothetical protein AAF432_00635 [Planctomycetota bacterium]